MSAVGRSIFGAMLGLLLASCFSPQIGECTFRCGAGGGCPADLTCGPAGWGHTGGPIECVAPSTGDDDGHAPRADAGVRIPDAPVSGPDAPMPPPTPDAQVVSGPDAPVLPPPSPDAQVSGPDAPVPPPPTPDAQ